VQAYALHDIAARYGALTAMPTSAIEVAFRTRETRGGTGAAARRSGLSGVGVRGSRGMERVVGGILWGTVLGTTSKTGEWRWGKHCCLPIPDR